MVRSRDTSVHVAAMLEVDMSRVYNFIQSNRNEFQNKEGVKLTYMPFIANAVIKGLREYPLINSAIEGSTVIKKKFINLGIAVAIEPTGLIVPNIKRADEKNIIGLAKAINDLAQRSRNKKLTPDDISGGTFTITNYGVFGTVFGTPIINQPEVAILGVGAVIKKPVVVEVNEMDTIAIKPIMALTLSHDHRLVDGMLGGRFLKFIKDNLENFDAGNL
jgi:2-oxoglutarate dehydrogenase E2 component (dihydrolipoamide succinyltransferase)